MADRAAENHLSERQKKIFGVIAVVIFILFFFFVFWFVGRPLIAFLHEPERFRHWVSAKGFMGRLIFIAMVVLQVVVAIIPGEPFEIGAGYAFGFWEGSLLSLIGILIGSALIFLFVRRWGIKLVELFFSREKIRSLRFLQNSGRLEWLTFIIMLIPGTPKDLLSYFIGVTDMKLSTWLLIVLTARLPSLVSSTLSGTALGEADYTLAILAFAITGLISLIGICIYRKLCSKHSKQVHTDKKM